MPLSPTQAAYQPGRYPHYIQHLLGRTSEIPQGVGTGKKIQALANHLMNFRYQGPVYMNALPPSTTMNDEDGTQYIILHYPPRTDAADRRLMIAVGIWGYPDAAAWYVRFRDGFGSGTWEDWISGTATTATTLAMDGDPVVFDFRPFEITPPAGVGGSGFKVVELNNSNCLIAFTAAWWVPDATTPAAQVVCQPKHMAPSTVIGNTGKSLDYLIPATANAAMNVETLERLSRRVFFNFGHPGGTLMSAGTALTNLFGSAKFGAGHRDLLRTSDDLYCYPAAVISATGQAAGNFCQLKYTTTVGGASSPTWTYTVPAGLGVAPQLITYDASGASPTTGPHVKAQALQSDTGDEVLIEGAAPAGATLTVHSAGLWEGPPW